MNDFARSEPQIERRPTVIEQLIGGSPVAVIVRLVILSFVVGLIMKALGVNPADLILWVEARIEDLANISFESFEGLINVTVLGAVVVLPAWAVLRILKILSR